MAGVSAGTGAMGSLLGKLTALLSGEYKLLKAVRKEIEILERELGGMQVLLEKLTDMEARLDGQGKSWRDRVRDLSYDMEDCIDRFMDRLGSGDAKRGFMKRTAHRIKTLWTRHDIATQIKELKVRVIEESERRDRYKLDQSPTKTVEIDPRITTLHEEVENVVAMDGRVKHITALLMDGSMELKVVPIVGSGGLGKTTLAMEVYRKIQLGRDFQCQASVSVSRTLDLVKLMKDILSQIDKDAYKECQSWEKEQLIREIKQILAGKRYFIVIDDVWKEQDWKFVKAAFPENNNGSRIIATTRITGVANLCCYNSGCQPYKMEPLGDIDSKRLFFKRIFSSDDPCPGELEEVSTRIIEKCGGLPLAIITFASLLAGKKHKKDEWERLQDSIGMGSLLDNDGNLKVVKDILLLSYWDLPYHLKTCLLYLCIYPEDYKIKCEELKWKWMAEGFLDRPWGRLDEVAENCINELVNRNLIQPIDIDHDGIVKYCRVHDMVLDLIISLSDEENFAIVLNGRICNSFPSKIRRLSMQSSGKEHKGAVGVITAAKLHVRSVTTFQGAEQIPRIVDFHALRVLDLIGSDWLENKHVKDIGNSHQLRYLRIGESKITELPSGIGKLQHLETLDLRECSSLRRLPSTVAQLQKLLRLFVSVHTQLPANWFRTLQALEELWFRKTDDPARFEEEVSESGERNLRYLRTGGDIAKRMFCNPCCTYPYLQALEIQSDIGMVPRAMVSLENLVELCISVRECDNESLQVLMGMPSLAHLQLNMSKAIKEKLTVGSNGFKLLKVFRFVHTTQLTLALQQRVTFADGLRLTFESGAVPALRQLVLVLSPVWVSSDFFADLGVEHLPGVAHLEVNISCYRDVRSRVEALESSVEKVMKLHPKREICFYRTNEHSMCEDEKEWEEAVAQDRKEWEEYLARKERLSTKN